MDSDNAVAGTSKRFVVQGHPVDFVIHPRGQVVFYLRGRWLGAGWVPVTVRNMLVEGKAPENLVFNGRNQTGGTV